MAAFTLPFLLIGCWPYIGGTWEENAPVRAAGAISWIDYEGAGWDDNDGSGAAYWGWFQAPQDDFGTDWILPAPTGCSDNAVDLLSWTDSLVDLGARIRLHDQRTDISARFDDAPHGRSARRNGQPVEGKAKNRALLFHDTDHGEGDAGDAQLPTFGIQTRKEMLRD